MTRQDKSKEIQLYDEWSKSEAFRQYGHFAPYGHNSIIKAFKKLVGDRLSRGCRAIDLGCGAGAFTRRFFSGAAAACFGLDISLPLINTAHQLDRKTNYLIGDIENLSFKEGSFDVVIFSGVLHHFPDIEFCLGNAYRVLRRGGCLLSYDPNPKNPFMWLYRHPRSPLSHYSKFFHTENERLLSAKEVTNALKRVGFVKVYAHSISGVAFKHIGSRLGKILLPCYNIMEIFLGFLPLAAKFGSFLIYYGEKDS